MYHKQAKFSRFRFKTPLSAEEEKRLIRQAKRGDEASSVALYERFQLYLVQQCLRLSRGWMESDDADDIISEANLALQESIHSFDPTKGVRFVTWLRLVVRRNVLAYLEKRTKLSGTDGANMVSLDGDQGTRDFLIGNEGDENLEPGVDLQKRELAARAMEIINSWPVRDRYFFLSRARGNPFASIMSYVPKSVVSEKRGANFHFQRLRQRLCRALQA